MKNSTDAVRSLVFEISATDVSTAKRYDKEHCVVANALSHFPGVESVSVGATVIHIKTAKGIIRYRTPNVLRDALMSFDASGEWNIPTGVYTIYPPPHHDKIEEIKKRNNKYPKRKRKYKTTGRNTPHRVNPRVSEFAVISKERKENDK